jgi:isopenicillin-N epimerase
VPAGIDFLRSLGEAKVRDHNRALALAAGQKIAQRWGEPMNASPELLGAMVGVRLPERWQKVGPPTRDVARALTVAVGKRDGIMLNIMPFGGALWCRVSAQLYNDIADYDGVVAFAEKDPPSLA